MIVPTDELPRHRSRVAMVDGGFDPLHPGHITYFREAATLGVPVLCNISSDEYIGRKHKPLLSQPERAAIIDAIRWIELVHLSQTPTVDVLRSLRPRFYVKGSDWRERLPPAEVAVCGDLGVEIRYLDTVTDSSTAILERYTS